MSERANNKDHKHLFGAAVDDLAWEIDGGIRRACSKWTEITTAEKTAFLCCCGLILSLLFPRLSLELPNYPHSLVLNGLMWDGCPHLVLALLAMRIQLQSPARGPGQASLATSALGALSVVCSIVTLCYCGYNAVHLRLGFYFTLFFALLLMACGPFRFWENRFGQSN